ncbi:hypothetical protein MLD38_009345 [Melastoma candidum]|uniref:Uncharacterized protein n=1 Tax=Melastoma candidum TaxID=119954 RepID=A0ACB9RXF1_9MYRT|nr:hypothetical protein MLD38_009345 [Melastoma candidum]
MAPKHFVIIHNAFHGKWIWDKFKPLLEAAGHVVTTFDLMASSDDPRPIESVASADQYSIPLLDVLEGLPEGEKVILVGHSFGGINAAIAMDKYPEKVELAVFLNALLPDTTHRPSYVIEKYMEVFDDWEDCEFSCYSVNKQAISKIKLGPTFVRDHLFQLSPEEDYSYAMERIRLGTFFPEPLAIRENFTEEGYGSIPRVFISCQQDRGIPTEFQLWEIENFPVSKVYALEGDHSPMYSDPKALLAVFLDIASTAF